MKSDSDRTKPGASGLFPNPSWPPQLPTKNQEAELAALGLVSNVPIKNGIIADLGGGSLELILIKKGKIKKLESLDIGHLTPVNQDEIINLFKSIFMEPVEVLEV